MSLAKETALFLKITLVLHKEKTNTIPETQIKLKNIKANICSQYKISGDIV